MASERGELGQFFDWLEDFNFYNKIDTEFEEALKCAEKLKVLKKRVKWMKKEYEESCNEKDDMYRILQNEGYEYCWCCNKWKKPLGEACTLWDLPE